MRTILIAALSAAGFALLGTAAAIAADNSAEASAKSAPLSPPNIGAKAKPEAETNAAVSATANDASAAAAEPAPRVIARRQGIASYYGYGKRRPRTASGQRFDPNKMTAAHMTYPFGTKVRVTNKRNGKSVIVTINDRGPNTPGRIIDVSTGAANVLGMRRDGLVPVVIERLERHGG
ncbi:septal ring lytic transglycosylase RlpA family protein [Hyphomicrobium sulfonivorans]|uniref:septal ring lytic transglycosylase RlpA family protein n=1 Tax=Hyphomicrobium sulfonivorans TaxID=121290 RepID=UPI0018E16B43|nr:septal ring lytic transglycosylase RlpA family protein [Hyphomicrobium sulfonivorans]MBI1651231.1 septal ring lytic transglycosylase RlpA family protein [Hyphomicrobium sulfonivorans]